MARVVIVINDPGQTIAQLNEKLATSAPEANRTVNKLVDYLSSAFVHNIKTTDGTSAATTATCQVTTRDTDPSVSTSGSGSVQITVTLD